MPIVELEDGQRLEVIPAEGQSLEQAVDDAVSAMSSSQGAGQMGRRQPIRQRPERFELSEAAGTLGQGAVTGLSRVAGAPVDLAAGALNLIPGVDIQRPVGGSEQISGAAGRFALPDEVRPALRPFARAGEVIGESLPIAAAPLVAAQAIRPAAQAGRMLSTPSTQGIAGTVVESARQAPGTFAGVETAGILGAAQGAAAAEALAPGNRLIGAGAEVAGGILTPGALASRVFGPASDQLRRGAASITEQGLQKAAGREISGVLDRAGEDPAEVAASLRRQNPYGLTSASMTESPTLTALERSLISKDPAASNALTQQYREAKAALNNEIVEAIREGSPEAFRAASQARQRYFESLVDERIALAERRSQGASEALAPDTPDAPAAAGPAVRAELDAAKADARKMETELWGKIPKKSAVPTDNLLDSHTRAREGLLVDDGQELPAPIESFVNRVMRQREGRTNQSRDITAGEMLSLRSQALEMAREMRGGANPKAGMARRLDIIADGVLADLSSLSGQEVDAARSFSRVLNEKFGPLRSVMGTTSSGGQQTPPELALQRSIGAGGQRGALAARQQREAVQPIETEFTSQIANAQRIEEVPRQQEQYVRGLIANTFNVNSGRVNPDKLAQFRRQNRELLQQFPELDQATASAESAERFAAQSVRKLNELKRNAERSTFARVASVENPSEVFASAIRGSNPVRDVGRMFTLARKGGDEAIRGARSSFLESAMNQASDAQGFIDGQRFNEIIDRHATAAVNNGVMSRQQVDQLKKVGDIAAQVRRTLTSDRRLEEQINNPSAMFDLFVSIAGANAGAASTLGKASGASLVVAGRTAARFRDWLIRAPNIKVANVVGELMENPKQLAAMLSQPNTARQRRSRDRQVNAFLIQMGLTGEEDDAETP
jgi:hypothetical protein